MTITSSSVLFSAVVEMPFGAIGIRTAAGVLEELVYLPPRFGEVAPTDKVAERAALQLRRYLDQPDMQFELPLAAVGTSFQRSVWKAIAAIPRGHTPT